MAKASGSTIVKKDCLAPAKRQMSPSVEAKEKKLKLKPTYNMRKNICRVSGEWAERGNKYGQRIKELKVLSIQKCGDLDLEDLTNFPRTKQVANVVRTGEWTRQMWGMLDRYIIISPITISVMS